MNRIPLELLEAILGHLPTSSCAEARLTSRAFNAILARRTFQVLGTFLDAEVARKTLVATARNPAHRARAIWSPQCLVPEGLPITESFLLALWASVHGRSWTPPRRSPPKLEAEGRCDGGGGDGVGGGGGVSGGVGGMGGGNDGGGKKLTLAAIQNGLGRAGTTTVETLRDTLFRYALYLSYVSRDDRTAPQAWVMDFLLHRDAERTRRSTPGIVNMEKEAAPVIAYWEGPSVIDLKE